MSDEAEMAYDELASIFQGMAMAKRNWLRDHGLKRGEMDRLQQTRQMRACERAFRDYSRAAERRTA